MPDYHKLYLKLFSAQADAIDNLKMTTERLVQAHKEAEESVMEAPGPPISLFDPGCEDEDS